MMSWWWKNLSTPVNQVLERIQLIFRLRTEGWNISRYNWAEENHISVHLTTTEFSDLRNKGNQIRSREQTQQTDHMVGPHRHRSDSKLHNRSYCNQHDYHHRNDRNRNQWSWLGSDFHEKTDFHFEHLLLAEQSKRNAWLCRKKSRSHWAGK